MVQDFGVVIITHGNLGESLLNTCRMITGEMAGVSCVSVGSKDEVDLVRGKISSAIEEVRGPMGVILLVDMFGGTPSNIALSFLTGKDIEVVTGVNLPMLTKLFAFGPEMSLHEAAVLLRDYGREHIKVATEYLTGD
jgi:PTS system mannose-specific IIA component